MHEQEDQYDAREFEKRVLGHRISELLYSCKEPGDIEHDRQNRHDLRNIVDPVPVPRINKQQEGDDGQGRGHHCHELDLPEKLRAQRPVLSVAGDLP